LRYVLTFIDEFSRKSWVYFLKHKSETFDIFRKFKQKVEAQLDKMLACLRTDRGGEYMSSKFFNYCKTQCIHKQLTASHIPHQNGISERKNRSLLLTARSLLFGSSLPTYLWKEAGRTANYLSNKIPTQSMY
jgi:transposase InsO family protein